MTQPNLASSFGSDLSAAPSCTGLSDSESLHGCEHLHELTVENRQAFQEIVEHYNKIYGQDDLDKSGLRPSFRCLQCSRAGEHGERETHVDETGHRFSVESSSMCVFCHECDDFVYDSGLERVRIYGTATTPPSKKRKSEDAEDEESFLKLNSTKRLCGPTGIRGLYNLGQTCYQNVVIQSLLHNPLLTSYFLSDGHKAHSCDLISCIGCAVSEAFAECHNTEKNEGYGAVGLLLSTWQTSNRLAGYQQQDAHDFFQFLVDRLHESTTDGRRPNTKDCPCFFHKVFYGTLRSTRTCNKCMNSTVTDDPIMDLSLAVQIQAKKRGLESSRSSASVDLEGCLKSYIAPEKVVAACQKCDGSEQQATKTFTLRKLPAILCTQLERFEHSASAEKVEGKLDFPMELNMQPYTTKPKSRRVTSYLYDLQSAIIHKGKADSGHYITYCRQGNQWFLFDDDKITLATEADVLNADAYLLFYALRYLGRPRENKQEAVLSVER